VPSVSNSPFKSADPIDISSSYSLTTSPGGQSVEPADVPFISTEDRSLVSRSGFVAAAVDATAILLNALWRSPNLVHQLGTKSPGGKFENIAVANVTEAAQQAAKYSEQGIDCYFATAEYANGQSRKAENAVFASSFWLDLDCGEAKAQAGKGYANVNAAHAALMGFCSSAALPIPTHQINSGGGLHVYWTFDRPLSRAQWVAYAGMLKALTHTFKLLADDSRTSDIASVLRVPGTLNYKYTPPRPVVLLEKSDPLDLTVLLAAVDAAHEGHCRPATQLNTPVSKKPSSILSAGQGAPDMERLASALAVLDPDCDDETWKFGRLAPLARVGREHPEFASRLRALAMSWSSGELRGVPSVAWVTPGQSNGITGEAVFGLVWERFCRDDFSGTPTTIGTIFHDAKKVGWVDENALVPVVMTVEGSANNDLLSQAERVINRALQLAKDGDVGAPFEPDVVAALRFLQNTNMSVFQRVRAAFKQANHKIPLGAIEVVLKKGIGVDDGLQTHHAYAKGTLDALTVDGWRPAAHDGELFTAGEDGGLWVRQDDGRLEMLIAELHDGKGNCKKRSDYMGIAMQAMSIAGSSQFFADAPVGVACPEGFYSIDGDKTKVERLTPAHRQRVRIDINPSDLPTPQFDGFMQQTFKSDVEGEEQQQRAVVQEIAGAIMLGLMPRHQKAILFFDPFGRAGKGTLMDVLKQLVPSSFIRAVSPFNWANEYYAASLAGVRLNVVGELTDREPIPASNFKAVLGNDSITGRNPSGRPITFKNEAAHVFMSNHMINTSDHTEAFFARWLIVEFPNSLIRSGRPLDPNLAERIIESEMAGIAYWALEGAKRLLLQGSFTKSSSHARLMAKWRRSSSSLEEFIHEACELGPKHKADRKNFYVAYTNWCKANGRRNAFSKPRVKELLSQNVPLGITLVEINGYETFKGVRLKPEQEQEVLTMTNPVEF
jgi:putative DNA primase/helicase